MESTTRSGAIGSSPRCATSMPVRVFLSSTALMLEEPTSRPTIVFAPNMCPPFPAPARPASFALLSLLLPCGFRRRLYLFLRQRFGFHRLLFHPLIQLRFLEAPAIAQLECRNFLFVHVLVQRIRTYSEILRSLANVHYFSRLSHDVVFLHRIQLPQPFCSTSSCRVEVAFRSSTETRSSEFWCPEHISKGSAGLSTRISAFYRVLWGFSGIRDKWSCSWLLYVAVDEALTTSGCGVYANGALSTVSRVTKVLETVRRC